MFEVVFRLDGSLHHHSLSRVPLKGERLTLINPDGIKHQLIVLNVSTTLAIDLIAPPREIFHLQLGQA